MGKKFSATVLGVASVIATGNPEVGIWVQVALAGATLELRGLRSSNRRTLARISSSKSRLEDLVIDDHRKDWSPR